MVPVLFGLLGIPTFQEIAILASMGLSWVAGGWESGFGAFEHGGEAMSKQQLGWTLAVLLSGLLVLSGCGPSKEQQEIDAFNLGVDHAEQGEYDKAIADCTEAIRFNPKFAEAYNNRGCAYAEKGEQARA